MMQIKSGKIGFAAFLHQCRYPGFESPACSCGWGRQDTKHVLLFCPDHIEHRQELLDQTGNSFEAIVQCKKRLKATALWILRYVPLSQYMLVRIQIWPKMQFDLTD